MKAQLLKKYLDNLTLTATDGKLEWIGTDEQWLKVKECRYCHGTGTMYVASGEDDVMPEICDCQYE